MRIILLLALTLSFQSYAAFRYEQILPREQIEEIVAKKNYFLSNDWSAPGSYVWDFSKLDYSKFFYKNRPEALTYSDTLDSSMKRLMDLSINVQTLMQSRMNIHLAVGELLPSINLPFGQGVDYGVSGLFRGLFGFVLPQQWLRLKNSRLNYKLAKLSLLKVSLDQYMNHRIKLYEIHRSVARFEIESFFFTHLELFSKNMNFSNPRDQEILQSMSRPIATDMAETANMIGIRFNDLASLSNLLH